MTSAAKTLPTIVHDAEQTGKQRHLSLSTLFGFSTGMIGDRIFRDSPALLLLIFMTNYLAVPPALAGIAIFIPKLLIMFVDPIVGTLSDRLNSRWGRRRPFMFFGALLAGVSIFLFFHVPHFDLKIAQAAYMSLMVFIGFTGYSLYSVPYLTMSSEMAGNDHERRKIMSWRVVFMAFGLSISAFAGGFVQMVGGGCTATPSCPWTYASICLVTMLTTVFSTAGVPTNAGDRTTMSLIAQFRLVASACYLRLLLVRFLQKLSEGIGY